MGTPSRSTTEREEEIRDEYLKTLLDLTFNSKPLIDVLTEVAEEEKAYASTIVDCIVEQLEKVNNRARFLISRQTSRLLVFLRLINDVSC